MFINTSQSPTKIVRSWGAGEDDWIELAAGGDVVRVDGPGTSHSRARHGEGMYHDEYVWLPEITYENFRCKFVLELELNCQEGLRTDVGRHGGVCLGVSRPYSNVFWPDCPRNGGDRKTGGKDGVWIGYYPGGKLEGKAFDTRLETLDNVSLLDVPTEWIIEVNQKQLQVTIGGTKVVDCEVEKSMVGFLGFWRARSGHRLIAHDLVVERSETLILQAAYDGKVISLTSLSGETACSFEVGTDEKLADVQKRIATEMIREGSTFCIILPSGEVLSTVLENAPETTVATQFGTDEFQDR